MIRVAMVLLCVPWLIGAAPPTPPPLVQEDVCPFEFGCDFLWFVPHAPIAAYLDRGDTTLVAFIAEPGDSLRYLGADMIVDRPGLVAVTRDHEGFQAGDTLEVLSYEGEGSYFVRFRGAIIGVEAQWDEEDLPRSVAHLVRPAAMTWWVRVMNRSGRLGWLALVNVEPMGVEFWEPIDMVRRDDILAARGWDFSVGEVRQLAVHLLPARSAPGSAGGPRYELIHARRGTRDFILLSRVTFATESQAGSSTVVAQFALPAHAWGQTLAFGSIPMCEYRGTRGDRIVAILTDADGPWDTRVVRAWRADLERQRFEEIAVDSVACRNPKLLDPGGW